MVQKIRSNQTDFTSDDDAILIPKGTTAQGATVTAGALRYNTTTGRLEVADGSAYVGVGIEVPTVTSVSPTNINATVDGATTNVVVTGTGFTTGAVVTFIGNDGTSVSANSTTRNSSTQLTAAVTNSNLVSSKEPFDVKVTLLSGLTAQLDDQININAAPAFVTSAGSLGTFEDDERSGISLVVSATDEESAGPVLFRLQPGDSLPAGLSLTSNDNDTCTIAGTATAVNDDTTTSFDIEASDAASNVSTRSFSITINANKSETFNTSGTFSVPTGVTAVQLLVVGSGGTGGAGGGGGAGLCFTNSFSVSPGGTVAVTVAGLNNNRQTFPAPNNQSRGAQGQSSVFNTTVTAVSGGGGGGPGGQNDAQLPGVPGGSGGGGGATGGKGGFYTGGQATQSPSGGVPGFGNDGGSGSGTQGNSTSRGGGGGGAGAAGGNSNAVQNAKGSGGDGKTYSIADGSTNVGYAGGAGGAGGNTSFGAAHPGNPGTMTDPEHANRGGANSGSQAAAGVVIVRWS
jgi:hypothetical protein